MVLASKEWLNNSEDEQNSESSNTSTATTTSTTAIEISASTANALSATTATTTLQYQTPPATASAATDGSSSDVRGGGGGGGGGAEIPAAAAPGSAGGEAVEQSITSTSILKPIPPQASEKSITIDEIASDNANNEQQPQRVAIVDAATAEQLQPLIDTNNLNRMSEITEKTDNVNNTNNISEERQQNHHQIEQTLKLKAENDSETENENDDNVNELENNNQSCGGGINAAYLSATLKDIVNSDTNTNYNSNANANAQTNALPAKFSPITAQTITNALQSVLYGAAGVSAANASDVGGMLPNNFLSTLGLSISSGGGALTFQANVKGPPMINAAQSSLMLAQNSASGTGLNNSLNNMNNISNNMESLVLPDAENNGQAKIVLLCEANSHPFQTRTIYLTPNIECKVGRLIAKSKASESNAIFDCKVLSRNHAVIWYGDEGKFWVKDTKSSNGTFINENKLGTEPAELRFGDIVKFGVDVLENARKEVHGCIITYVQLYLPDGREAVSIEESVNRTQYSGDNRISFDDLHRLNLYMQETSQREKVLKSKLFNIQNVLDATRKNSALCWQSMVAEDQLLHRINSLEKKLQIMEKNVPENSLKSEICKLLDDKASYQQTAKDTLRKVYQERCEALQMLAKAESDFNASANECKILREQVMTTSQSLQDLNARLLSLQSEHTEQKEELARGRKEAIEQEEQRTAELAEKLRRRDLECDELRHKISELMLKRAELIEDEQQLEQQAIEKLDAAIADMDVGDDDDDDDDDEDDVIDATGAHVLSNEGDAGDNEANERRNKKSSNVDKQEKYDGLKQLPTKHHGRVKDATIMKWLKNSDLNEKEGSLDIFKAICNNESDSSDEHEPAAEMSPDSCAAARGKPANIERLNKQLEIVEGNLRELDAEMAKEAHKTEKIIAAIDASADSDEDEEEEDEVDEFIKENKNYTLIKSSVEMLHEAYKEMCKALRQQAEPIASAKQLQTQNTLCLVQGMSLAQQQEAPAITLVPESDESCDDDDSEATTRAPQQEAPAHKCPSVSMELQQRFETEIREYRKQITELNQKLVCIESDSQNTLEIMQIECDTFKERVTELTQLIEAMREEKRALEVVINENKLNVRRMMEGGELALKTDAVTSATQEIMEQAAAAEQKVLATGEELLVPKQETKQESGVETPKQKTKKLKVHFSKRQLLEDEKAELAQNETNANALFEQQIMDDMALINNGEFEREEELMMYKDRLEHSQTENLLLRDEIAVLKRDPRSASNLRRALPIGAAAFALVVYFLLHYF